jgi:hypothetical protein
MDHTLNLPENISKPRLRALVEIDGSELRVYPITDNDADEKRILDALRFIREDFEG